MNSISETSPPSKTVQDAIDVGVLATIAVTAVVVAQRLDPASVAGNRAAMVGILTAIAWAFLATRLRGCDISTLGLGRPASWKRTAVLAVVGTVVLFVVAVSIQNLLLPMFLDQQIADTSRFDSIRGNPRALIRTLAVVWTTAAFGEEVVYRGFLIPRLARLFGDTRRATIAALLVGAVGFAFLHLYQGAAGVVIAGWTGIALGALYLLNGRNIWAAVLAHGLTHLISFSLLAAGALPA